MNIIVYIIIVCIILIYAIYKRKRASPKKFSMAKEFQLLAEQQRLFKN